MELNQLFEGSNNYKTLQADAARLSGKWAKSGLLEGISNEIERNNMAMILENQAKQIVSEGSQTGTSAMGTSTSGAEQWAGVALPLVRKVFAQIAAKDFVSVQPMNLPSGLVFYLDFKYGTSVNGRTSGDNLYGNVSTANSKIGVDNEVSGGLYGGGQFGYSINERSASEAITSTQATSASIAYQDGILPSDYLRATVTLSTEFDVEGVRAFRLLSGSAKRNVTNYPEYTTTDGTNVTFIIKKSDLDNSTLPGTGTVVYHVQPTSTTRGDFEDGSTKTDGSTTINIPEINVSLGQESIVAKTRKLKAQWTPE